MPHFIIDCSENIVKQKDPMEIMEEVYHKAASTGLFVKNDIKVRIHAFRYYLSGASSDDFIHIFGNIMEGRTTEQKRELSSAIISGLKIMFPDVPVISIDIRDFEKATYCNKSMLQ
ncbi:MAG: 5-carboxymethyl-2-hydroxymuconate Delta-isomerase [Bacteroidales bacterium]|nr:5-carboxymethyl-2-hydroxymuconate Delta-isomerase [Bacteroidales bacterium]